MAERFYVQVIGANDTVVLTGEEAHHLARVRRIHRGETVQVFDGSGIECEASVREIGKDEVVLTIESRRLVDRELPFLLTLACSPAKGDRLRWLVQKAVELGVTRFIPLLTRRTSEQARGLKVEKMARWVIEVSKQCGRNVLMELSPAILWEQFLPTVSMDSLKMLADPTGVFLNDVLPKEFRGEVTLAVGPEGGFTAEELEFARSCGWIVVSLGPRVLRVETAALALAARMAGGR